MTDTEKAALFLLKCDLIKLREYAQKYKGRTIDNIVQQVESRIKYAENGRERN